MEEHSNYLNWLSVTLGMASAPSSADARGVISDPYHTNCSSLTATFSFTMPSIFFWGLSRPTLDVALSRDSLLFNLYAMVEEKSRGWKCGRIGVGGRCPQP